MRRLCGDPRLLVALVTGTLVPDFAYYAGALPGVEARGWGTLAHGPIGWALLAWPAGGVQGQVHAWVVRAVVCATGLAVLAYAALAWWWRGR